MASSTPTSIESLIESFPNTIDKVKGLPTFKTINRCYQLLQSNAASVQSSLGGGKHGYVGIVVTNPASYARIAGYDNQNPPQPITFVPPVYPGARASQTGVDAAAKAADLQTWKDDMYEWRSYDNMVKALRKQLVSTFDEVYLSPIKDRITGFNNVSINDILVHLMTEYGNIGPQEIAANEVKMIAPWDGVVPFESIMTRIDECVDFAVHAKAPYTNEQVLAKAELLVLNSDLFPDELKEWDRRPAASRTYNEFTKFMLQAQRANRKRSGSSKQAGYGLSLQKLTELAEGVAASVEQNNKENMAARAEKDTTHDESKALYTALVKQVAQLTKQQGELLAIMKLNLPTANFANIPPTGAPVQRARRVPIDEGGYCWSHGYLVTKNHTSANCRFQKDGHVLTATRNNPMNGSTTGKPN
jgi:uncharacterized phage-associated protein